MNISNAIDKHWDIVVVGGGMGGGTIAKALTGKGFDVLLLEKGHTHFEKDSVQSVVIEEDDPETRLSSGKWPHKIKGLVDNTEINIWSSIGCGAGGSTLLYAAALQRLDPRDFEKRVIPTGEEIAWPFTYEDLCPYYQRAETIFSVCGTHDPLGSDSESILKIPPKTCEADQSFFNIFKANGLNPYRLHVGIKYLKECHECAGKICQSACKQTAYNCAILPALNTGRLKILERTKVLKFEADETRVKSVYVNHLGTQYNIRCKTAVLAAGAMFSPIILLRSKNQYWPNGLANESGLVGKNLMFHATDFIAFWPKSKNSCEGPRKTIAMRDYYVYNDIKLGEFQSSGLVAGYNNVLYALRLMFDQSKLRNIPFIRHFLRIPAFFASKIFGQASVFATILEDNPYNENKVVLDESEPSGMRFEYTIRDELKNRYFLLRNLIRKNTSNLRSFPLYLGVNLNYGHSSGTCRAGYDPKTSVLNKECRSHSIENLYVADGSFMPTSGGTNPSLTIAANALRVADIIERSLKETKY
jgi:choline dehydrogenase-like flavoprotein